MARVVPYTFSSNVRAVPIEDLVPGMTVHGSQLLPTETLNVENVYELARLGLTNRGIAGKLRVPNEMVPFHFGKTIAAARADRAAELLMAIEETADDVTGSKVKVLQHDARKYLLDKRLDPQEKEPAVAVVVGANALPITVMSMSVDEVNDL